MMKYLDDISYLAGCILILIGTYQICPVATWFVGGVMLIIVGVIVAAGGRHAAP